MVENSDASLFRKDAVPSVVFTSPEVAQTGPTAAALAAEGIACKAIRRPYGSVGKALADGYEGTVKILVSDDNEMRILGISILGPHAADLIAEATVLVTDAVPIDKVASRYIHAHPTLSEIFC